MLELGMAKNVYIHSFTAPMPPHSLPQGELVAWIIKAHQRVQELAQGAVLDERPLHHFSLRPNQIGRRYFECNDVSTDWESHEVYRLMPEGPGGVGLEARNLFFTKVGVRVFSELYGEGGSIPEHLIHVTCTGYASPSAPQLFFGNRGRAPDITHAYHMGCYASLPAVRMAGAFIRGDEVKNVDVLHTEVCSLHMEVGVHTPEQIVVQTLFADGHMRYRLSDAPQGKSFLLRVVHEKLLPDSAEDMKWIPSGTSLRMTLSKEVPMKIRKALPEFIQELCLKAGVGWEELQGSALFAIHPGGPKIIEATQRMLELRDDQVRFSDQVLKQRGNMSSATLPHVWKEIIDSGPGAGTKVVSLTFGPGLTVFGALFEVCG